MAEIVQTPIRSVYKDDSIVVSNVKSKIDNATTSYSVVSTWYDGTPMDDSKVDQFGIYSKYKPTGEYLRENKPQWGENFLEVNTMIDFRGVTPYSLFLLKRGYYKGVRLNGYYVKSDTPASVDYLISDQPLIDNLGNIITVSDLTFLWNFGSILNVKYFGVKSGQGFTDHINRAIAEMSSKGGDVIIDEDLDIEVISENSRIYSGVQLKDNVNLVINGVLRLRPNANMYSVVVGCVNISNFKITGKGQIYGDRNSHLVNEGGVDYWVQRLANTMYYVGQYVTIDTFGFLVTQTGYTSSIYPVVSALEINDEINDGTAKLKVVRKNQRIRYNNRLQSIGQWLWYGDVAIKVTQAGMTASTPITINNPQIGNQVIDGTVVGNIIQIGKIEGIGEYGMGITLYDCDNFEINGVTINECFGDGILLSGTSGDATPNKGNTDFKILHTTVNDCRRQGMSVLHAKRFKIDDFTAIGVFGTLPMAGIDLEPEQYNSIEDGQISNVKFLNCYGGGLKMYAYKPFSKIQGIKVNNVYTNNCGVGVQLDRSNISNVEFNSVSINNSLDWGFRIHRECRNIKVTDLTVDGVGKDGIIIGDNNNNLEFNNVTIRNAANRGINMFTNSENVKFKGLSIDGVEAEAIFNKAVKGLSITNFDIKNCYSGIYMYNGNIRDLDIKIGSISNVQRNAIYLNTAYKFFVNGVTFKNIGLAQDNTYYGVHIGSNTDEFYVADLNFGFDNESVLPKYCILNQSATARGIIGLNKYSGAFRVLDVSSSSEKVTVQRLIEASTTNKGLVKKTAAIPLVSKPVPNELSQSSASTLEALLSDYNGLVTAFNQIIQLTGENKTITNNKLNADVLSEQQEQLVIVPLITNLTFNPSNGNPPYVLTAQWLNKSLIDDVNYKLEARLQTTPGSCLINTFPGAVNANVTNALKNTSSYTYNILVPNGSCVAVTVRIVKISDNSVISQLTAHINNIVEPDPEPEPDPEND